MMKRIALLVVGLSATALVTMAPAQASPVHTAYDTNWPCSAC